MAVLGVGDLAFDALYVCMHVVVVAAVVVDDASVHGAVGDGIDGEVGDSVDVEVAIACEEAVVDGVAAMMSVFCRRCLRCMLMLLMVMLLSMCTLLVLCCLRLVLLMFMLLVVCWG